MSRRTLLGGALGIAGLAGLGATTASANPQGQIGTSSDPLRALNVEAINTGLASTQFQLSVGGSRALLLGQQEQTQALAGPVVLGHSQNSVSGPAATISGGGRAAAANEAGRNATVAGGNDNRATANASTISGGFGHRASGRQTAIGGGISNSATSLQATVGGGNGNTASADEGTVGGGRDNTAGGTAATVSGGRNNDATGEFAIVPGGQGNSATAPHSFAGGTNAAADHEGAFIWCDTSSGGLSSANQNEFAVSAAGGTFFFSNEAATTGVVLSSGSGSWSSASSRTLKSDIDPVDGEDVLEQVTDLEISRWSYDSQEGVRHMGPMAEEFYAAFGLGDDEEKISTVDADGVAFAAIQGLAERQDDLAERVDETAAAAERADERLEDTAEDLETTDERVAELEAENEALREELSELRAEVEFIENAVVAADGGQTAPADGGVPSEEDAEETG